MDPFTIVLATIGGLAIVGGLGWLLFGRRELNPDAGSQGFNNWRTHGEAPVPADNSEVNGFTSGYDHRGRLVAFQRYRPSRQPQAAPVPGAPVVNYYNVQAPPSPPATTTTTTAGGTLTVTITALDNSIPHGGPRQAIYTITVLGPAVGTPVNLAIANLPTGVTAAINGPGGALLGLPTNVPAGHGIVLNLTPGAGAAASPGGTPQTFRVTASHGGATAHVDGQITLT